MGKYEETGNNDPILRCHSCTKLVHRGFIHKYGKCNHCGSLKFRQVSLFTEEEADEIKKGNYKFDIGEYTIDPEFFAMFEEVGEAAGGSDE
jgi:phage FluMu protein Com